MKYVSIDRMTRSVLLQKRLPIHYYLQMAKYIVDGLRELRLHSLGVVNTTVLPVTAYGAIELPCDFVDWVVVGLKRGQFVQGLVQRDSINRLTNRDETTGEKTTYGAPVETGVGGGVSLLDSTTNDLGEATGRWFGLRQGEQGDTFKLIRERGEIQLHESIDATEVYLEYISSGEGEEEDTATKVDWRAQRTLETYADWQEVLRKVRQGRSSLAEAREAERLHYNALRILRAQTEDLDEDTITRIIRDSYTLSLKN